MKIRGYYINPVTGEHGERIVEDNLNSYYNLLDCNMIDIVSRKIGARTRKYYEIVCDDEGLLRSDARISAINDMGGTMLVGSLFITGSVSAEGELTSLTDADVAKIKKNLLMMRTRNTYKEYPILCQCDY